MISVAEQLAVAIAPDVTRRVLDMPQGDFEHLCSYHQDIETRQQLICWLTAAIVDEIQRGLHKPESSNPPAPADGHHVGGA
jgi:hypothetical protein